MVSMPMNSSDEALPVLFWLIPSKVNILKESTLYWPKVLDAVFRSMDREYHDVPPEAWVFSPYTVVDWRSPGTSTPSIAPPVDVVQTSEAESDIEPVVVVAAMANPPTESSTSAMLMAILGTLLRFMFSVPSFFCVGLFRHLAPIDCG
jgi:hypothetical protein